MSPRFNPALARPLGIAAVALVGASSMNLQPALAEDVAPETPTLATAEKNTERTALENDQMLADTVKKAEAAGVKVTKGKTETVDASITTLEAAVKDANADYERQADRLEAAIVEQKQNENTYELELAARQNVIDQNKAIDASNAQMKAIVDAAQKAHDDAVAKNAEIAKLRQEIQASNNAGLKAYVEAQKEWEAKVTEITETNNAIIETNNRSSAENAKRLAELTAAVKAADPTSVKYNGDVNAYNQEIQKIKQEIEEIEADNLRIIEENRRAIEDYNRAYDVAWGEYEKKLADAQAQYEKDLAAAQAIADRNAAKEAELKAKHDAAMADYRKKLETYNKAIAEYERLQQEATSGNANTAVQAPEYLAVPQNLKLNDNRSSLVSVTTTIDGATVTKHTAESAAADKDAGRTESLLDLIPMYNSDHYQVVEVNWADNAQPTIGTPSAQTVAKYENIGTDASSGRTLNAEITFTNLIDPESGALDIPTEGGGTGTNRLAVYSNFIDNVSLWNIQSAQQNIKLTYADTGAPYDQPYYLAFGSLNRFSEGGRAEFVSPLKGVLATYQSAGTQIAPTAQLINGRIYELNDSAVGYMKTQTQANVGDSNPATFTDEGVTFLVDGSGEVRFRVGSSGTAGRLDEPKGDSQQWALFNHVMMSTTSLAGVAVEPTKPKEPTPETYTPEVVPTPVPVQVDPPKYDPPAGTPLEEVPGDVQVLAFTPGAPVPFIPQAEPEDIPVPPVPEYKPVAKIAVPDEPVKKQAEAQYKLIDVRLQEADLKIAKTILDNDASDGSISFRIDGGNAGAITAADVLTTDLKGEGIVSIELSEALYNGEKVDDNKLRLDGDKAVLKNVAPGDTYSFVVTAEVDPNADVVTNGVKTTSPDDPDAGNPEDPQRNDGLEDDTDGWDEETTPVRNTSEQKLNKKFISFDEETGKATYEIEVENSRALGKNVVLTDIGGEGLSNPVITKAEVIQGDATHTVETEAAAEAGAEPTAEATGAAQGNFTHNVTLTPGASTSVAIFGSAAEAKGAEVELGTPTGAISASWKGADVIDITAKENASGVITLPYTITKDGVTVEETIGITVEAATDTEPVIPAPEATAEAPVVEEAFVAPAASEQDGLMATDPAVIDDLRVDGATATVDAMAVGERLVVTVEADVAKTARLIDNAAFVTSDNGTNGKDGSQTNEDVPSDTDGWDKEFNELDRPADLRVNKEVVDGDASDHKVSFRITGANVGVGDSPETVIADMTEHRVGLENPVISEVKLGADELSAERYTVAESGDAITVDDLKAGEEVSYLIEFDVTAGATEITNAASVTSPKSPVDPKGEIQENEDIPGDNDQKDKVSVDPVAPDLKVLKEIVDADASDGKLSFKVSGANLGTANAPETRITDELAKGLKNPVISEVSEGATIIEEEGVTGILVDNLTVGAEASFVVEFDVEPGVTEVYNAAYIDSPYAPVDTEGEIQDNNDLPGDEDQRDGVSLTADPNLKVDKEVVDGDMSDGKVSFRISGGNFGGTVEGNVLLKDAEREGLVNGTISEVVAPEGVETSVNGETLTLSELKPGETASYLITFEVLPDAAAYTNIATIESDTLKPGDGDVQENEGLDADEDQKDRVSLEKPAEPETPADPTDPAEPGTPAEGEPGTPADGGTADSGDTVVKGETARTGDEATISPTAKGIGLGVVGGLLVGLVAWFNRTRIAQLFKREG